MMPVVIYADYHLSSYCSVTTRYDQFKTCYEIAKCDGSLTCAQLYNWANCQTIVAPWYCTDAGCAQNGGPVTPPVYKACNTDSTGYCFCW